MSIQEIIQHTADILSKLPKDKAEEVSEFADFVLKRHEEQAIIEGVQKLNADSSSFDFLKTEENLYTEADLKEVYHA